MSDIYLSITETPTVVTLSQPVISGALSSTVTVANTVTVALDANSLSALEQVTVTVGAAVSVSNFPASQVVSVSNFPASSSVTIGGFSTSSLPPSTVTVGNTVTIAGTVTANVASSSNIGIGFRNVNGDLINVDNNGSSLPVIIYNGIGDTAVGSDTNNQIAAAVGIGHNSNGQFNVVGENSPLPISGTVTARLQDASGNNLTSTSIGGVQRLNVSLASAATPGGTLPSFINIHGGTDGSVARTMLLDSSGRTVVTGTFWQSVQPAEIRVGGSPVNASNALAVQIAQGTGGAPSSVTVSLTGTTVTVSSLPNVTIGNSVTIASIPAISGTVTANTGLSQPLTDTQLRASSVPVSGPLTDTQLRATAVPVSGTFWQATQPVSIASVTIGNSITIGSFSTSVTARLINPAGTAVTYAEIGTAGNPSIDVLSIQGVTSGTAVPVSISSVTIGAVPSGALTTRFGSVTTANTAQISSAVTNASRKYLFIQNVTTSSNVITIGIGFTPTTTQGIQLSAGGAITFESSYIPTGAVYILSSVTASPFTILEA